MIEVNSIVKYYGDFQAVKGISFSIEKNGVYGFLGPNGAGKSTTMNIIAGCLAATEGTVKIGGFDIFEEPEKAKRQIGYLPEIPPLYTDMTPHEYLKFVAGARKVSRKDAEAEINRAIEATGLSYVKDRLIEHLSKGYRQRVGIAETLLGDPQLIILDEPTVGLDPKQITEIRQLVKNLGENHIVLFSSHILSEVQEICDDVIIIARGETVADSRTDDIEKLLKKEPVIRLNAKASRERAEELIGGIGVIDGCRFISSEDGVSCFELDTADAAKASEALFFAFSGSGLPLLELHTEEITLEEAFLELTSGRDTYAGDDAKENGDGGAL